MANGFLYAVRMVIPDFPFNPVKIGFTTAPENRSKFYGGSGPFPIEWLGVWPADAGIESERHIHATFAAFRLQGEWFFPQPDILALIDRKLKAYPEHQESTKQFQNRSVHKVDANPLYKGKRKDMIPGFLRRWEDAKAHLTTCPSCSPSGDPSDAAPLRLPNITEVIERVEAFAEVVGICALTTDEAATLLSVTPEQLSLWRKQGVIGHLNCGAKKRYAIKHLRQAIEIMQHKAA